MSNYNANAYSHQRICKGHTKTGEPCKGIAIIGSEYCRRHCGVSRLKRIELKATAKGNQDIGALLAAPAGAALGSVKAIKNNTAVPAINRASSQVQRYAPGNSSAAAFYSEYLQRPDLLDLRNEVALLQSMLQQILNNPNTRLELQLQVLDRMERFVTAIKRIELTEAAMVQANEKVRLVVHKCAIIINNLVPDRMQRRAIAKALLEAGLEAEAGANSQSQPAMQPEPEPEPDTPEPETPDLIKPINSSLLGALIEPGAAEEKKPEDRGMVDK